MRFGYVAATNATYSWLPTSSSLYTDAGATSLYTGGNTATVYAKPSSSTTYTAVASVGTCSRSTTTTIDQNPILTGVISGSEVLLGATSYLSIALTGTGPWNITYTDGVTPVSVSASSSPKLIECFTYKYNYVYINGSF